MKQYTCIKCLHKGVPKQYWKGGNYMENKLFYENDLEWMEEMCQRERHMKKEKM